MAQQTAGTQLFLVNPDASVSDGLQPEIVEVGCPTAITIPSEETEQIEITCLNDLVRRYRAGLRTPGAFTFTIAFDDSDDSHELLFNLQQLGTTVRFIVAFSGDDALPSIVATSAGATVAYPTTRSFFAFDGYVSGIPFSAELNGVYTSEVSVQVDGPIEYLRRAAE